MKYRFRNGSARHVISVAAESAGNRSRTSVGTLKALWGVAALIAGLGTVGAAKAEEIERSPGGKWVKGRILVAHKPGLPAGELDKILKGQGARATRKLDGLDIYVIELPLNSHGKEDAVARALARNPHVKFAEVDEIVSPEAMTNDPILSKEWHIAKISGQSAWDSSTGAGATIAIIDTGVKSSHPDLATRIVPGWNVYGNNNNSSDVNGHGTAVAGAAAATGNNGIGVVGVSYTARIMPVRATDSSARSTFSILANGLTWAADHGAKVANLSFSNLYKSSTMQTAAQYLRNKGGVTVVSANNNGTNESAANTSTMITVSATNQSDVLASFSSWGSMVDVSAPGVSIQTTLWNGGYGWGSGTSFAAPIVAGTVALMMAAKPGLAPSQIESLLYKTAKDLGTYGYDTRYGHGRVNAGAAVQAAKAASSQDTTVPSVNITSPTGGTVKGTVPVIVSASDNVGIAKVLFYAGGTLIGIDTIAPYSFSWDTTRKTNATYSLLAKANDGAGNVASSKPVSVTVWNTTSTATTSAIAANEPLVGISSPANGSSVNGIVTIDASASDASGIASLDVYVDGVLKCTGNAVPLSCKWNSHKAVSGMHTITATAENGAGEKSSTAIRVIK